MSPPASRVPNLVLVPTALEERLLDELGGLPSGLGPRARAGFGPISAAARTAQLLAELAPRRVLLVGIAGSYDPARAPLGSAASFARARLEGVGAGSGPSFVPASSLGFPQWDGGAALRIEESLALCGDGPGELLTVCAASATPLEAAARSARHPAALGEDMEAFGAALACRLRGVPLAVVRGISNAAGERDTRRWLVREALAAARELALEWLERVRWPEAAVPEPR